MRKKCSYICLAVWACGFLAACGSGKEDPSEAAETYYRCLMDGKYEEFVAGIAYSDSMTEQYRSQMVELVAQYAASEQAIRGGLASVTALNDTVAGDMANVFIIRKTKCSGVSERNVPFLKTKRTSGNLFPSPSTK